MITLNTVKDNLQALDTSNYTQRLNLYEQLIDQQGSLTDEIFKKMLNDRSKKNQLEIVSFLAEKHPDKLVYFGYESKLKNLVDTEARIKAKLELIKRNDTNIKELAVSRYFECSNSTDFKILFDFHSKSTNFLETEQLLSSLPPEIYTHYWSIILDSIPNSDELFDKILKRHTQIQGFRNDFSHLIVNRFNKLYQQKKYEEIVQKIHYNNLKHIQLGSNYTTEVLHNIYLSSLCELELQNKKVKLWRKELRPERILNRHLIPRLVSANTYEQIFKVFPGFFDYEDAFEQGNNKLFYIFLTNDYEDTVEYLIEHPEKLHSWITQELIKYSVSKKDIKTVEYIIKNINPPLINSTKIKIIELLNDCNLIQERFYHLNQDTDVRLAVINRLIELKYSKEEITRHAKDPSIRVRSAIKEYLK